MKPTVGRIVHYTSLGDRDGKYPPEVQAALVTKITPHHGERANAPSQENRFEVSLRIFYADGEFNMRDVMFTESPAGTEDARGKWTWPSREVAE